MKWYTSSDSPVRGRCVSSAKGLERAKELWTERISSELERASPRSCGVVSDSGGNDVLVVWDGAYLRTECYSEVLEFF